MQIIKILLNDAVFLLFFFFFLQNFSMCFDASTKEDVQLKNVYERTPASEDYYTKVVLGLQEDTTWSNMGGLRWQLVLCLAGRHVAIKGGSGLINSSIPTTSVSYTHLTLPTNREV